MKSMRVIDFFCGAGGFSEGFRQEGFQIIMGIDNWLPAIQTHNLNHGLEDHPRSVLDFEDIHNIQELPDSEIIVGSPPCVSFSLSNKGGNADKTLGIRLIKAYLRVIAVKKHQPDSILKAWLMENVPNSRNYVQETYTFKDLDLTEWAESHRINPDDVALTVKENGGILKASDYGAPQARHRFVCGEITATNTFAFPETSKEQPTLASIINRLPTPLGKKHASHYSDPNYPKLSLTYDQITDHFYDTGVYEVEWRKALAAKSNHPYMGPMSFPENPHKPSRTLLATRSASTREAILYKSELRRQGNGEYRMPTVREGASLMGFPISYIFYGNESHKWRQIGNAVCPQLSAALARALKRELNISIPPADFRQIDIDKLVDVTFLDTHKEKNFDKPPVKSPKAAFRGHPIKSGNMTVALTNTYTKDDRTWTSVAYVGTGKQYKAVRIDHTHHTAARRLINTVNPEITRHIDDDEKIRYITQKKLDDMNAHYHYSDEAGEHPLSLINHIADYISQIVSTYDDPALNTFGTTLSIIKEKIPLSQLVAIYAIGQIVTSENTSYESHEIAPIHGFAYI